MISTRAMTASRPGTDTSLRVTTVRWIAGVCARSTPAAARRNTKLRLLMALIAGNRIRAEYDCGAGTLTRSRSPDRLDVPSRRGSLFPGAPGQLDRLAVGSVTIGVGPGFFALQQRGRIGQTLAVYQSLQSRQPVVVIARAIVRLTSLVRASEFGG